LRLLLGLAFSGPEIDDAELVTDKANDAAVALAKRAGFELASVQGNTARWRIPRERLALLRMAEAMPA
jgi:RimJ/RimL family protein N-acetyltransferase